VLELGASLPPDGSRAWYFPGAADHGHADIVARVQRRDGSWWTACLARPDPFERHDGIFVLPCGERLFVAGGIVDRDKPASWTPLPLSSPRATWSPDRAVVALHDGTSVHVFGQSGPLWSATLGSDAAVRDVTSGEVVCWVYDWATGEPVTRRFDLLTGQPRPSRPS
jgi:hypothetical protein